MTTLYISHPAFLRHETGYGHPECPDRLRAIETALEQESFQFLLRAEAPRAPLEAIARVHSQAYIDRLHEAVPSEGLVYLDLDTPISPGSWEAALRAAGATIHAVDQVIGGKVQNAFCAVRPPGHHAEPNRAMGFCLFNNVAIAAEHAHAAHGLERVAVVDFDVHHGNGTQAMFWSKPHMFYASTHERPLFPGTGDPGEQGVAHNIVNVPLRRGDGGARFREAYEARILPALTQFSPDLIMISAGFDAHRDDPLAGINLVEEDFAWVTRAIAEIAGKSCDGRIVSVLEGGYDLHALAASVAAHLRALMEAG